MSKGLMIVLLLVVLGGGYVLYMRNAKSPTVSLMPSPSASSTQTMQKLADSPVAGSAFKIFPGALSAEAKQAMNGFSMQATPQTDGSTVVVLTSTNPEYQNQQYIVKAGDSLYFIEKSSSDDQLDANADSFLKDDSAVIVNDQGYILP